MLTVVLIVGLIIVAIIYRAGTPAIVTARQLKNYIVISSLTLLFFSTSFGIGFIRAFIDPNPPHSDNGIGMATILFGPPFIITLVTLIISALMLYLVKTKGDIDNGIGFILKVLIIPVGLFGLLCVFASIFGLLIFLTKMKP